MALDGWDKRSDAVVMTVDPANFFRDMMGQWGAMAGQAARPAPADTPEAAARMEEAMRGAMSRALAAYNMPSRDEVSDVSERLSAVEARLGRIEALLTKLASKRGIDDLPASDQTGTRPPRTF